LFGLFSPVLGGAAVAGAIDVAGPSRMVGPHTEYIDNPVAASAGVGTAGGVAALTMRDLMLQDPRWSEVMQRPSRGTFGALLGAGLGYLASKAIEATPEVVDALRQEISDLLGRVSEVPGPQAGATDFTGPLPNRQQQSSPLRDEQRILAQRLMRA
jgi:hypothetical protein